MVLKYLFHSKTTVSAFKYLTKRSSNSMQASQWFGVLQIQNNKDTLWLGTGRIRLLNMEKICDVTRTEYKNTEPIPFLLLVCY